MNNKLAAIEDLIEDGVAQQFKRRFGVACSFQNVSSKKALRKKMNGGAGITYPLMFASLTGLALPSSPSYRASPLLRRGITGHSSTDHVLSYNASLIPVWSTYEITLLSNQFAHIKSFSKAWLMCHVGGYLKFSVDYGVVTTDIHLELDPNLSIPIRDSSPEVQDEFEMTANFTVHGYMSKNELTAQQAAVTIEIDGKLVPAGDEALDRALAQTNSTGTVSVFNFRKEWPQTFGPDGSEGDS